MPIDAARGRLRRVWSRWVRPVVWAAGLCLAPALGLMAAPADGFSGVSSGDRYYPFAVDEDAVQGPPDQSFLNPRPLGPADRVVARDGHFFTVGPDGVPGTADDQRIRFFGASLSYAANFPPEAEAARYARRLRRLGFNAIRLHHLDSFPGDETDPPRSLLGSGPYPTLNPEAVRRLRALIAALSREGIYINLNLFVGYRFRSGVDDLPPSGGNKASPEAIGNPVHIYYPPFVEKQQAYARMVIDALGLADNPALAMVEINNESSMLAAWVGGAWYGKTWRDAIPEPYAQVLRAAWRTWIEQRYGTVQAACEAWDRCDDPDPAALPVTGPPYARSDAVDLPGRILGRFDSLRNLFGNGGAAAADAPETPELRYEYDFLRFLVSVDRAYFERMKATVRTVAAAPVPMTGTQMKYGGVLNFDSQQGMDYLDDHIYLGHPVYADGRSWRSEDWRIRRTATASGAGIEDLLALSLRRAEGKPFVVSEFNQPFPSPGGSGILPVMAAVASLQDWDGLFYFAYDDSLPLKEAPWYFSLSGNWGHYAFAGPSARLFRQFGIPALTEQVPVPLPESWRYFLETRGHIQTGTLERYLRNQAGMGVQAAWSARLSMDLQADQAALSQIAAGGPLRQEGQQDPPLQTIGTPTGSVRYSAAGQQVILNVPSAWGVFGRLVQGAALQGPRFTVRLNTPDAQQIQLLATPLDGLDIGRSGHFLLSLGSDTTGSQPGSMPPRPKGLVSYPGKSDWLTLEPDPGAKGPSGILGTRAPSWVRRYDIELDLPVPADRVRVQALDGEGRRVAAVAVGDHDGHARVRLQETAQTASLWYELTIMDPDVAGQGLAQEDAL